MNVATDACTDAANILSEAPLEAATYSTEAYVSEAYARAERDKLWRRVWQQAGRTEEIPEVGNYLTYDILDDSILIVRTAPDKIRAYYNVCSHRGRRLVDTPKNAMRACGKRNGFVCGFHGWRYNLDGQCTHISERGDWQGSLTEERTHLGEVQVEAWGGWIWINMDPNAEPLRDYLEPAASILDPFELGKMRYKWRKWVIFDCNWKVALEAFNETYHVPGTHPEFRAFGTFTGYGRPQGKHSQMGYDQQGKAVETQGKMRLGVGGDPRVQTAIMQKFTIEKVNAVTTQTLVDAAIRLVDELPEGTPADVVYRHWIASAKRNDAARGVIWPEVDPAHVARSASSWQVFPNFQIGHALTHALCYSARPYGYDPNKCIFEAFALERFPVNQEPKTDWIKCEPTLEDFGPVLIQDFANMAAVQQGMRNGGFRGPLPNPKAEGAVISLHRNLARYMGTGEPRPLK
jgi:phenylpropionate dioxygenase-like ring-hydroxylating dioxygenase large terminal subunit